MLELPEDMGRLSFCCPELPGVFAEAGSEGLNHIHIDLYEYTNCCLPDLHTEMPLSPQCADALVGILNSQWKIGGIYIRG